MIESCAERDFEARESENERWLKSRVVCDSCGEPIEEDLYYEPEHGLHLCERCWPCFVKENFERSQE